MGRQFQGMIPWLLVIGAVATVVLWAARSMQG